jgi:hypothetical protein
VGIAFLLVVQGLEVFLNDQVDGQRRGVREEVLKVLGVHAGEVALNCFEAVERGI